MQYAGAWRSALVICFGALSLGVSGAVQAASLGKIEVASPLGKVLYAEVPLNLKSNELASKVFIEIASVADYKIFEVYRDPVLNAIRADVASDARGARVKLTSRVAIQSPFFNLVLKIRYGRVSHFKKYAVFLDANKSIQLVAEQAPEPHVKALDVASSGATIKAAEMKVARIESAGKTIITKQDMLAANESLKAKQAKPSVYQGWARSEKYGPIVRGDTLSVVARRLRVDQRYSTSQIMVALFEKNKKSFNQNNLNLLKAKSFLQIPTAEEVEKHSKSEAYRITLEHRQAWKKAPHYALEADVQRKRYSPRVRVGKQADGQLDGKNGGNTVVSQSAPTTQDLLKSEPIKEPVKTARIESPVVKSVEGKMSPVLETLMQTQAETNQLLTALQQKNEQLQQQLIANKDSVDALNEKVDEGATAASNARMQKLELLLTRLQGELDKQEEKQALAKTATLDWVTWLLLSLLIMMLGVIAILMRKEPAHPSSAEQAGFDNQSKHQAATELAATQNNLEENVEKEVNAIETDEQEVSLAKATGKFDAMASFTDELSDTDTAELEAFDVDAKQELDPNVDYVSEADVYIRYGMDEEALQQLDMALRLNSSDGQAHIKKARVLHNKQDKQAFAAAFAAATAILGATDLDQYKTAVESFGGDVASIPDESDLPIVEGIDTIAPVTMAIDDAEIDALDFDMAGLNEVLEDQEAAAEQTSSGQASDVAATADLDEGLDWLSDPAFDGQNDAQGDDQTAIETIAVASGTLNPEMMPGESGLLSENVVTQELDSLLGEFAVEQESAAKGIDFATESGGNESLDGLLSEFAEPDDIDDALSHLNEAAVAGDNERIEVGATQHLDSLLSEFSQDELSFTDTIDDFSTAVSEPAKDTSHDGSADAVSVDVDANYGATQELDSLLAEFSDDDDGLSFVEPEKVAAADQKHVVDMDLDHGATQELDSLLGEFSDADSTDDLADGVDHGATQVLGHLLDEFHDDEDETKKS